MKDNSQIGEEIKKCIHGFLPEAEVMMFGSRARNEEYPESDYDILLVTNSALKPREKLSLRTEIRKSLLKAGIRSDILIQSRSEVERKKKLPGHIVRSILKEAVLL